MPELPDLQAFSKNLTAKLHGKRIQEVTVPNTKKLKTPLAAFKKALEDLTIKEVLRVGKELHIIFTDGTVLGLHLMLHGTLSFFEGVDTPKHTVVALFFSDKTGFALADYQGIATPTLNPEPGEAPDALDKHVNFTFLKGKLAATRTTIKNFLLDQHNIRGIGNAYADEILWDARLSPFSICNKIPDAAIKQLAHSITTVLRHAEKEILKTHPDIISGEVRDFLQVHNARKTHSPTGAAIQVKVVSSRKSYFTDEQELYS